MYPRSPTNHHLQTLTRTTGPPAKSFLSTRSLCSGKLHALPVLCLPLPILIPIHIPIHPLLPKSIIPACVSAAYQTPVPHHLRAPRAIRKPKGGIPIHPNLKPTQSKNLFHSTGPLIHQSTVHPPGLSGLSVAPLRLVLVLVPVLLFLDSSPRLRCLALSLSRSRSNSQQIDDTLFLSHACPHFSPPSRLVPSPLNSYTTILAGSTRSCPPRSSTITSYDFLPWPVADSR